MQENQFNSKIIKVDIISGFLGAGKTTLLKKIIGEALKEERIVIIENEYGETNIDSGFLQEYGIDIKEMTSGCICCSLVGDFQSALYQIAKDYRPDRIIIEPSGVGKTSDIIKAINAVCDKVDIILNLVITVVDVTKYELYSENFGEFFDDQIANANTVILSRTQNTDTPIIENCIKSIHNINTNVLVSAIDWSLASGVELFNIFEQSILKHRSNNHNSKNNNIAQCTCKDNNMDGNCHCHNHHDADEIFSSVSMKVNGVFTEKLLKDILQQFNEDKFGQIMRAKGNVHSDNGNIEFDFVPDEINIRHNNNLITPAICVIGIGVDKSAIRLLFSE